MMQVTIREWEKEDLLPLCALANDEQVARFVRDRFPHPYTQADGEEYLKRCMAAQPGMLCRAIEVDGVLCGSIELCMRRDVERHTAELGYWLGTAYARRGIMTQAVRQMVQLAMRTMDVERICAEVFASNVASQRVLEKNGFVKEGVLQRAAYKDGMYHAVCLYGLLREEDGARGVYALRTRVQLEDVDQCNGLSCRGALRLMQESAGRHSDVLGYGFNDVQRTGLSWVIVRQKVQVCRRVRWNTPVEVRTWSRGAQGAYCLRDYEILDETGEAIAKSTSTWVLVDAKTMHALRPQHEILEQYGTVARAALPDTLRLLREPEGLVPACTICVGRRDIDMNHHLNNLCFLDYALQALPHGAEDGYLPAMADVMYRRPAFLGDRLLCCVGTDAGEDVVAIKSEDGQTLHALLRFGAMPEENL